MGEEVYDIKYSPMKKSFLCIGMAAVIILASGTGLHAYATASKVKVLWEVFYRFPAFQLSGTTVLKEKIE